MYNVSNDYKAAILKNARAHRLTGTVDGVAFDGEDVILDSFLVKNQLTQATEIMLGGVYIGELDLVFSETFAEAMSLRGNWRGVEITGSIGVEIAANTFEDIPIPGGVYNVDEAQWTDAGLKIVAFDNMVKFDRNFTSMQSSGEAYDLLLLFCQECGVTLGMTRAEVEALPNGTEILGIYTTGEIETFRDLLSQLATVLCCFATMDRSGHLVLRRLPDYTDIVATVGANMRYSTTFSDFASYYDTITVVNAEDETLRSYSNGNVNGLTMNLGTNCFMQYGTDITKNRIRQAVVDGLEDFRATPYSVMILPNPAYDLGDLVKFSGGIGQDSLGCIMSFVMKVSSTSLEGYGENPALASARSKTDKEISGLLMKTSENEVIIHTFENAEEYELDDQLQEILSIRFATIKPKVVNLWHEIELDVEADPLGDGTVTCQAVYVLNNEVVSYSPVTTWNNDGLQLMHLLYFLESLPENRTQQWQVYLKVEGGTATIGRGDIHASLYGQGLAAVGAWGGLIECSDNYSLNIVGQNTFSYSDSVSTTWNEDVDEDTFTDSYVLSIVGDITFGYSDSVYLNIITPIYTRITDEEDVRITDEGDVRITDGDEIE